jgi:hypothetical protein
VRFFYLCRTMAYLRTHHSYCTRKVVLNDWLQVPGHVKRSRATDQVSQVDDNHNHALSVFRVPTPTSSSWWCYLPKALGQLGKGFPFISSSVSRCRPAAAGGITSPKRWGRWGSVFPYLCPHADQQRLAALTPRSIGAAGEQTVTLWLHPRCSRPRHQLHSSILNSKYFIMITLTHKYIPLKP